MITINDLALITVIEFDEQYEILISVNIEADGQPVWSASMMTQLYGEEPPMASSSATGLSTVIKKHVGKLTGKLDEEQAKSITQKVNKALKDFVKAVNDGVEMVSRKKITITVVE